ncbi:MAG: response regulator transcription factor [Variovorax sp.]|jgi:two-component system, OmpR family, response regulator RegX3|nr:MAG: response regulator transcription factor [Variovorax sp.]
MHIALLEDDIDQRDLAVLWLTDGGHTVSTFEDTRAITEALKGERFDLLLLDWMLPDGTGGDVLTWVRQNLGWSIPVVVLTSRDDEATVLAGLDAGADDYVVKPPKPLELLARIAAISRRFKVGGLPVLRMGDYEIDVPRHRLSMDRAAVALTQKEFELSVYLFQNPGVLLSRDHLLNKVWGINAEVDTRTVDTHISRLRKKLKLDGTKGWKLTPVYGYGYRFDRAEAADPAAGVSERS